jgi:hypothetical protein
MKKIFIVLIMFLMIPVLTSCNSNEVKVTYYLVNGYNGQASEYSFAFYDNDEWVSFRTYKKGDYIEPPNEDSTSFTLKLWNYDFAGWFTDREGTIAWNFNEDRIERDLYLYGVFVEVED